MTASALFPYAFRAVPFHVELDQTSHGWMVSLWHRETGELLDCAEGASLAMVSARVIPQRIVL